MTATDECAPGLLGRPATDEFAPGLLGRQCWLELATGERITLPTERWRSEPSPGDELLLAGCTGPTLDIGCGPGRLTAALLERGVPALGTDVSAVAVRLARAAGAVALRRDVFERQPGEGRWRHALLADGNIGIGGDPVRLLRRVRERAGAGRQRAGRAGPAGRRPAPRPGPRGDRRRGRRPLVLVGLARRGRRRRDGRRRGDGRRRWVREAGGRWFAEVTS